MSGFGNACFLAATLLGLASPLVERSADLAERTDRNSVEAVDNSAELSALREQIARDREQVEVARKTYAEYQEKGERLHADLVARQSDMGVAGNATDDADPHKLTIAARRGNRLAERSLEFARTIPRRRDWVVHIVDHPDYDEPPKIVIDDRPWRPSFVWLGTRDGSVPETELREILGR